MRRRELLKGLATGLPTALVPRSSSAAEPGRYQPTWAPLDARPTPPWYTDAKFGIFIHWGVYSVPSYAPPHTKNETPYAEWYWHSLQAGREAEEQKKVSKEDTGTGLQTWAFHKRVYGRDFAYQNFAPLFRAELFDPDQWADLFLRSGAKYVALTSKHHEGFTLWRSAEANRSWGRPWNAVDIGPKRDVLLDLSEAGRRKGLRMGVYYSLYEWFNPLWLSDRKRYVTEHMNPQFKNLVNHAKPSIIFSDGEWDLTSLEWHSPELLAWLFNEAPVASEIVVNDRWGKDTRHKHGGYFTTEYTAGLQKSSHAWEEDRGMGFSFGYNRVETAADYRTERELILMLVDIVSRGGNLLLDIGPTADGRIPVIMQERLLQMGNWLRKNGEAIYGTKPWTRTRDWNSGSIPKFEEKEFMGEYDVSKLVDRPAAGAARIEMFYTAKEKNFYLLSPHPTKRELRLKDIPLNGSSQISMLGDNTKLNWRKDGSEVVIHMPDEMPPSEVRVLRVS